MQNLLTAVESCLNCLIYQFSNSSSQDHLLTSIKLNVSILTSPCLLLSDRFMYHPVCVWSEIPEHL